MTTDCDMGNKTGKFSRNAKMNALVILAILFFFSCCREPVSECVACSTTEQQSSFVNKYLRYIHQKATATHLLISEDSLSGEVIEFELCQPPAAGAFEDRKIIKASGAIFESCEVSEMKHIAIQDFEIIDHCSKTPYLQQGSFTLADKWFIYYIEFSGAKSFVPCESFPNRPFFQVRNSETIIVNGAVNGITALFKNSSQTSFSPSNPIIGQVSGTSAENHFESMILRFFKEGAQINYTINQGKLRMSNAVENLIIEAYIN